MVVSRSKCRRKVGLIEANKSCGNIQKFEYLGTTITKQNCIHQEINSRLNSGNAYYHSVQSLLSSSLFSKHLNIIIDKTIILHIVCTGVKLELS
jgi:hypothetical protein